MSPVFVVFSFTSRADMGFFGSIVQNPVPADTFQVNPFIELSCEDVLIEVYPGGVRGQFDLMADQSEMKARGFANEFSSLISRSVDDLTTGM